MSQPVKQVFRPGFSSFKKTGRQFLFAGFAVFALFSAAGADQNGEYRSPGDWTPWDYTYTRTDLRYLPNGADLYYPLESWFPGIILSNPSTGGFAALEPVTISSRGESILWQRTFVGNNDITAPFSPGRPVITIPLHLIQSLTSNSASSSYMRNEGFEISLRELSATDKTTGEANFAIVSAAGGPTWIPSGLLDRNPSDLWGAATKRRGFKPSLEVSWFNAIPVENRKPVQFFYEGVAHTRDYLRLETPETGYRHTLYLDPSFSFLPGLRFFYQTLYRSRYGIESGHAPQNTMTQNYHSAVALYEKEGGEQSGGLLSSSLGFSSERLRPEGGRPQVWDLQEEALYRKITEPADTAAWFAGATFLFPVFEAPSLFKSSLRTPFRYEGGVKRSTRSGGISARTWHNTPLDIAVYETGNPLPSQLVRLTPAAEFELSLGKFILEGFAGFQFEGGFSNRWLISRFEPTGALELHTRKGTRFEFRTSIQHDAIPLSVSEVAFLDPSHEKGRIYFWNDLNGDLVPDMGEQGAVIRNTGSYYHQVGTGLKHPVRDQFYAATRYHFSERWSSSFAIHGKRYTRLYIVGLSDSNGYTALNRSDVTGSTLYNREIAAMGTETYLLNNNGEPGYFASAEIDILKKSSGPDDPFFIRFNVGAYYAQGVTVSGNGPDYNDLGVYSEKSADPNYRINTLARIDFDRAYTVHLIFGTTFFKNLVWSNIFRYRDGEPFGQATIADGLTQGPVIVQNQTRSEPPEGMPRFTFGMTWDTRIAWLGGGSGDRFSIVLDIYNLFDFRSELYENTLAGPAYRDSMEMESGRTFRLNIESRW